MSKAEVVLAYLKVKLADTEVSKETYDIYVEKFSNMSDKAITEYITKYGVRLYVDDKTINQKSIDKLVDNLKIIKEEKLNLNFIQPGLISKEKALILPIQMRRLQQLATKESASNLEVNVRDKINQATRESKTAQLTDAEVTQLVSVGFDKVLVELLSPRSDNPITKEEMNIKLKDELTFSLGDLSKNVKGKSTVNYLDALFKSINIATDLVDSIDDIV